MQKETTITPKHVGIIMSGNKHWAAERNLSEAEGYKRGCEKMKQVPAWLFDYGVKVVSVFAFSAEKWDQLGDDINKLMKLAKATLEENLDDFMKRGYKLLLSGRIDELPGDLAKICLEAEAQTKNNVRGTLNICFNYSGRAEIVDAMRKMMKNKIALDQIHEGMIRKYLYKGGLPDPDIIIRTSGEQKSSGFLMWQSPETEMVFLKKYWPDFEKSDVDIILDGYHARHTERRGEASRLHKLT